MDDYLSKQPLPPTTALARMMMMESEAEPDGAPSSKKQPPSTQHCSTGNDLATPTTATAMQCRTRIAMAATADSSTASAAAMATVAAMTASPPSSFSFFPIGGRASVPPAAASSITGRMKSAADVASECKADLSAHQRSSVSSTKTPPSNAMMPAAGPHAETPADASTSEYRSDDVFLSLKNPIYKAVMYAHFQKVNGNAPKEEEKIMAKVVYRLFKRGGGRFFKLQSRNMEGVYVEVDDDVALEKIKCDFARRMESSKYWCASAGKTADSIADSNNKSASYMLNPIPRKSKKSPSSDVSTTSVSKMRTPAKSKSASAKARTNQAARAPSDIPLKGRALSAAQDGNILSLPIPRKSKKSSDDSMASAQSKSKTPATPWASWRSSARLCATPVRASSTDRTSDSTTVKSPAKANRATWQCPSCPKQFQFHPNTAAACIYNHMKTHNHELKKKKKKKVAPAKKAGSTPARISSRFMKSNTRGRRTTRTSATSSPAIGPTTALDKAPSTTVAKDRCATPSKASIRCKVDLTASKTPGKKVSKEETEANATKGLTGWQCPTCSRRFQFSNAQTRAASIHNHTRTHEREPKEEEADVKKKIAAPSRSSPRLTELPTVCLPTASTPPTNVNDAQSNHETGPTTAKKKGRGRPQKNKDTASAQAVKFTDNNDAEARVISKAAVTFFGDKQPSNEKKRPSRSRKVSSTTTAVQSAKATPAKSKRSTPARSKKSTMMNPSFVTPTPKKFGFATPDSSVLSTSSVPSGMDSSSVDMTPTGIILKSASAVETKSSKLTFPEILHALVSDATESTPELAHWNETGDEFTIMKEDVESLGILLKRYFRHNKFTSLKRQLDLYGWKLLTDKEDKAATFGRDGFAQDSTQSELQRIKRNGSAASKKRKTGSKSKRGVDSTCTRAYKKARTVAQPSSRRLAPKRRAFAEACSGIKSALTKQDKHENVGTLFDEDSDEGVSSVAGEDDIDADSVDERCVLGDENSPPGKENVDEMNQHGVDSPESKATALGKPKKNRGNSPQCVKFMEQVSEESLPRANMDLSFVVSDTVECIPVWSPIKLTKPRESSPGASSADWSQMVLLQNTFSSSNRKGSLLQTQTGARKHPSFSPIALTDSNVAFQGLPSWHSRSTIGSIAGLPHIDIDNLLSGDLGDDSMIDFIVGAHSSPQKEALSSTPMKSHGKKYLTSPLSVTPRKRRAPSLAGTPSFSEKYSTPFQNRKRLLHSPLSATPIIHSDSGTSTKYTTFSAKGNSNFMFHHVTR